MTKFCKWVLLFSLLLYSSVSSEEPGHEETVEKSRGSILFFHHLGTTSHLIILSSLAKGLADYGYNVTTVFWKNVHKDNDTKNYHQLFVPDQ